MSLCSVYFLFFESNIIDITDCCPGCKRWRPSQSKEGGEVRILHASVFCIVFRVLSAPWSRMYVRMEKEEDGGAIKIEAQENVFFLMRVTYEKLSQCS